MKNHPKDLNVMILECSGREFDATRYLLSVIKEGNNWIIGEGFDGIVYIDGIRAASHANKQWIVTPFTAAECAELADYMINLWSEFKKERGQ